MNVEFNQKKDLVELSILAPGQCFISSSRKKVKKEKIVWMKSDEMTEEDTEEDSISLLCMRLTGDHAGVVMGFDAELLVTQIDFKLVEE